MEGASIDDVKVINETDKAILVDLGDRKLWVPKSAILDESDVWSLKNPGPGALVVAQWFAEKEGLA